MPIHAVYGLFVWFVWLELHQKKPEHIFQTLVICWIRTSEKALLKQFYATVNGISVYLFIWWMIYGHRFIILSATSYNVKDSSKKWILSHFFKNHDVKFGYCKL